MKKILIVTLLIGYFTSSAQTKLLTLDDAILGLRTKLAPTNLKQLSFAGSTERISFVDTTPATSRFIIAQTSNLKSITFISLDDINNALKSKNIRPLNSLPQLNWISSNECSFQSEEYWNVYLVKEKSISIFVKFNPKGDNLDIEPKSKRIAYTFKNELYLAEPGKEINIAADNNENIIFGQAVHRNEFGIEKGTFWSPNGNKLAFYRMDQSMVEDYPIVNWLENPAQNNNIKYPMSGRKSHQVTVGIYDVKSGQTIYVDSGEPKDQYLTNIAWSPDEQIVYIAVLNREQNFMRLNAYSAITGKLIKTLFTEENKKYVEPLKPIQFIDKDKFVWQSNRDGYNHLYLYDKEGTFLNQLTKGDWEVMEVNYADSKKILYTATTQGAIYRNLYKLDIPTAKSVELSVEKGTHTVTVSPEGKLIIDHFQSSSVPRTIKLMAVDKGNIISNLLVANNPLKDYNMAKMEIFTIKSMGGQELYCRLYKPLNMQSGKRYPTIVYLYNGPHAQLIQDNWITAREGWFQYMAQLGYVVFTVDGRGSDNRGRDFEQAIHRQLGNVEMQDQLTGVEYLKQQPFVDPDRIGVHGWSFGGFMTTSLMTRRPGIFKVGVAGGPVIDWSMYEIMYTERYMDTPQENPEGYKENNLLDKVDKLNGKLLMIHGADDDVVVWQHSMLFLKSAVDKGIQLDYFVYPGHKHNVLGKDRVHLMQKITDYFVSNL
jgi:dipeptidyl-peptidase-4